MTLTLPEAAWGGDTVTVSHRPGAEPDVGLLQELRGDGEHEDNSRPTAAVADTDDLAQDAPPGVRRTAGIAFADPDIADGDLEIVAPGETPAVAANALTVAVTAEPADLVKELGYDAGQQQAYFTIKDAAALCELAPRPDSPFTTTVTVTATDSGGASVLKRIVGTTAFACGLPVLASASVDGRVLTLTFSQPLDEGSAPAPRDFAVTAAGGAKPVSGVDVSGSTVVLTLASAVGEGETVTVSYAADAARPIRRADGTGEPAESFADQAFANVTGETPVLERAVVHGTTLTLLYDEPLDQTSVPATGDFEVTVAGDDRSVTGVEMTRSAVVLTLADPAVTAGQRVTVSYARGTNPIQDIHANRYKAANLDGVAVDNRASDTRPPQLLALTVERTVPDHDLRRAAEPGPRAGTGANSACITKRTTWT